MRVLEDGIIGIKYQINEWAPGENGITGVDPQYDWTTESDESDRFFDTPEEATADVRSHFN